MREVLSYPSYDKNERRTKKLAENAGHLEEHTEEIERDAYKVNLEEMEVNLKGPIGREIEELFGEAFLGLSTSERFAIGSYLFRRGFENSSIEKLKEFSNAFGSDVLRTCLVTEDNPELERVVYQLAAELPREKAIDLFHEFAGIVREIDNLETYLRSEFGSEDFVTLRQLAERQLDQSRKFLSSAYAERHDTESLRLLVKEAQEGNSLFLNACRLLRKEGKLSLEAIRDGSLEVHSGDISQADANTILEIQEERYREKYPEAMQEGLRNDLSDALKSPYSRFYLYRKDGEIVTYVRYDDLIASNDVEKRHMASFMTNPKFEGGALGQALLEVALQNELGKDQPLYAECDPSLVPFYEKFGFILLRSYKDDHGVETCDIMLESESESLREAA